MEFPHEIKDQIRQLHHSARATAKQMKLDAEVASRTERVWAELEDFLTKGWVLHILELLEEEAPRFRKMRADNDPAIPFIDELQHLVGEESKRLFRRYPAFLEEACRSANLTLDANSRHPKYSLDQGFFRLEIDEKNRQARLSDYEGRLAEHPADVQAVVETIQKEHRRIFGRPFNGQQFLKRLRAQYKAVVSKENLADGDSVPIRHITRRMGKNVKGFRTDEFLVDLSRLAEKGPLEIDGRRLDLQQTKDINQGMLLHGVAARGYIGFIVFREA